VKTFTITDKRDPERLITYVKFTAEEEQEIASVTFDMLCRMHRLFDTQKELLDNKFWFGRAGHATGITWERFMLWLDCVIEFDSHGPYMGESLLIDRMPMLSIGMQRYDEGEMSYNINPLKEDRQQDIMNIWRTVWSTHPIRMAHERYKEWPYDSHKYLMNQQASRIISAERTEIAFWKARAIVDRGLLSDANFYQYLRQSHKIGPDFLIEMDRDEWQRKRKEIAAQFDLPEGMVHDIPETDEGPEEYQKRELDPYEDADEYALRKAAKKYGYKRMWE